MEQDFSITLAWNRGYEFSVDFEREGVPRLLTDEPPPLGGGGGPNPARLLAAAIGNCMSASLKYCLDRSRVELLDLKDVRLLDVRTPGEYESAHIPARTTCRWTRWASTRRRSARRWTSRWC
jgi:organic hydroperoxide reductase OsmC/OhrA